MDIITKLALRRMAVTAARGPLTRWFNEDIRLRVKGDFVETSNGHNVTLAAARELLRWVLARRRKNTSGVCKVSDIMIEMHEVKSLTSSGVLIGCTLIPWSEIDRIAPQIQNQQAAA